MSWKTIDAVELETATGMQVISLGEDGEVRLRDIQPVPSVRSRNTVNKWCALFVRSGTGVKRDFIDPLRDGRPGTRFPAVAFEVGALYEFAADVRGRDQENNRRVVQLVARIPAAADPVTGAKPALPHRLIFVVRSEAVARAMVVTGDVDRHAAEARAALGLEPSSSATVTEAEHSDLVEEVAWQARQLPDSVLAAFPALHQAVERLRAADLLERAS